MKSYLCVLVLGVAASSLASVQSDIFKLFSDKSIWNCVVSLNEECVDNLAKRPVDELFKARHLRLGSFVSIEKVKDLSAEKRSLVDNVWDLNKLFETGLEYMSTHALKLKLGNIEARMMPSEDKADSVELVVEARRRGTAKSQKLYRVIIPLVIGFKITGLVIFGIVTVKLFLLKAALVANTALMVAGGIVVKKLYDHGMGMLNQHQSYLNSHMSLPNYYSNGHDFSGFSASNSYPSYSNHGFEAASSLHSEVAEPVSGEVSDLHGGFSNHAIAMAALNKTLLQHHQPMPKRRWGHKWSPWQTTF